MTALYANTAVGTYTLGYSTSNVSSTATALSVLDTWDDGGGTSWTLPIHLTYQLNAAQAIIEETAPGARKAPPLEFNRYINASDLLEEFIGYLGTQKVRPQEVMGLPVELFIKWLIIRACEEDHEEPDVTLQLPAPRKQPRCVSCQRFMPKAATLALHPGRCAEVFTARSMAVVA